MSHPSKRISQQELESYLWGAAVLLRGRASPMLFVSVRGAPMSRQAFWTTLKADRKSVV